MNNRSTDESSALLGETARVEFLGVRFDEVEQNDLLTMLSDRGGEESFAYIVTPNVDHLTRLHANFEKLSYLYSDAWLCLCDSKIIHVLAKLAGYRLPVVPGSDLTAELFAQLIKPGDNVCIVGGSEDDLARLRERFKLESVSHYNPPMGFVRDPAEIEKCVDFVVTNPSRYVFLAVGSPQQEIVAHAVYRRNGARGVGFCIGASIDFLTGKSVRAPLWMQKAGMEWLHRLLQSPRRMWRRYLIEGPRIFGIYARWLLQRKKR